MIRIEGLTKQYGATTVVDQVSLEVERNSIAVVVGTSGSGKSTLLRMINRLVEPTSGRVLLDGADTRSEPAHLLRRRIGYAIQGHGLFPHRTVAENVATVPRLLGWPEARIHERVSELLEIFQLDPAVYAPSSSTRPLVGSTRRLIMRSSVDFPDPEVPTITVIELRSTSKETSSTTVVASYCLVSLSMRITARPG